MSALKVMPRCCCGHLPTEHTIVEFQIFGCKECHCSEYREAGDERYEGIEALDAPVKHPDT